jgi:agmatine deiminase
MPVQTGRSEFVRFIYAPSYLKGCKDLITDLEELAPIPEMRTCRRLDIVLDGGNVVGWGSRCIVTDSILRENPEVPRAELLGVLRELLQVDDLIVIPVEPGDEIGHADGVVRFLDSSLVLVNDYSSVAPWYGKRLGSVLRRAGLEWVELPYRPEDAIYDGMPSAVGCYANYLMVKGLIVVPAFGLPEDALARRIIEKHAGPSAVTSLDCTGLARGGGVLNCVTWTVASDRFSVG